MVDILMPYAEAGVEGAGLASPRLVTLSGVTVGIVNNSWRCMNVIGDELTARLTADFGVQDVLQERISAAQTLPEDLVDVMATRCDAVVVGIGN